MANQPRGPLTDQHYQQINTDLRRLAEAERDIALAKAAGFECEDQDQTCQWMKQRLSQIKQVYFPDRP